MHQLGPEQAMNTPFYPHFRQFAQAYRSRSRYLIKPSQWNMAFSYFFLFINHELLFSPSISIKVHVGLTSVTLLPLHASHLSLFHGQHIAIFHYKKFQVLVYKKKILFLFLVQDMNKLQRIESNVLTCLILLKFSKNNAYVITCSATFLKSEDCLRIVNNLYMHCKHT